jgi:hypothetical protein
MRWEGQYCILLYLYVGPRPCKGLWVLLRACCRARVLGRRGGGSRHCSTPYHVQHAERRTQDAVRSTQHSVPDSSAASICLVLLLLQLPPLMSSAHPARAVLCLSWPPSASLSHLCNTLRIDRSHQGTPGQGSCINATCSRTVRPLLHSFCSGNPRLLTPSQLQLALFPLFPPCSFLPIYFQPQDPS